MVCFSFSFKQGQWFVIFPLKFVASEGKWNIIPNLRWVLDFSAKLNDTQHTYEISIKSIKMELVSRKPNLGWCSNWFSWKFDTFPFGASVIHVAFSTQLGIFLELVFKIFRNLITNFIFH